MTSATLTPMATPLLSRIAAAIGIASPHSGPGALEVASPFRSGPSHLEPLVVGDLWGEDAAERVPVGRAAAMGIPAVARARNALAPVAGRLPLRVYRDGQVIPTPSAIMQPERVAARTRVGTLTWTVDALLFYGRAWWVVNARYADTGLPRSFEWVPEWRARLGDDGNLVGVDGGRDVDARDVVRIDGPHEGVLTTGSRVLRQAMRLDAAALRASENPVPAIELHQTTPDPLTTAERQALVTEWAAARRRSGIAYTSAAIEARTHGQPVEQLMIEGRKHITLELARLLGVPAWVVDAEVSGSSLTYSNVPSRSRELVDGPLTSYLAPIEARLSMDDVTARGQTVRVDYTDLLRADFGDRMSAYKTALDTGVYTLDELREMERAITAESTGDAP